MAAPYIILVINPGSTSTKLSLFKNQKEFIHETIHHPVHELKRFGNVYQQKNFRLEKIQNFLNTNNINIKKIDAVVGRGGLLKPLSGGVYRVNKPMLEDLEKARYGEHASNLGGILAYLVSEEAGCPAYIVDPPVVDEMEDVARLTGMPEIERRSIFHALNQKSAARQVAENIGKSYGECNFIVAHLGGGISVGAHRRGRVIDVNNALDGDGPFSPERAGGLPAGQLVELCFSGRYTLKEMKKKITGSGGLVAYTGSNSLLELKKRVKEGNKKAQLLYTTLSYKISQEIAKHSATLKGEIDCIVITGGGAGDNDLVMMIKQQVGHLAPVEVVAGEREMLSLALGALSVLTEQEKALEYTGY